METLFLVNATIPNVELELRPVADAHPDVGTEELWFHLVSAMEGIEELEKIEGVTQPVFVKKARSLMVQRLVRERRKKLGLPICAKEDCSNRSEPFAVPDLEAPLVLCDFHRDDLLFKLLPFRQWKASTAEKIKVLCGADWDLSGSTTPGRSGAGGEVGGEGAQGGA